VLLLACLGLFQLVNRMDHRERRRDEGASPAPDEPPLGKSGAFELLMNDRYLLLIVVVVMMANFVNSNGEFLLGAAVRSSADRLVGAHATGGLLPDAFKKQYIALFYANYQKWTSILSAIIQMLIVGRVFKWFGVRIALFVLPVLAMGGYALAALIPVLSCIRLVKIT